MRKQRSASPASSPCSRLPSPRPSSPRTPEATLLRRLFWGNKKIFSMPLLIIDSHLIEERNNNCIALLFLLIGQIHALPAGYRSCGSWCSPRRSWWAWDRFRGYSWGNYFQARKSRFHFWNTKFPVFTLWGVLSFTMFCRSFLTCSSGRMSDTAATVQPKW